MLVSKDILVECCRVGATVGDREDVTVGAMKVGFAVLVTVGGAVGALLGRKEGFWERNVEGIAVGKGDGPLGDIVGSIVGLLVTVKVGFFVGLYTGTAEVGVSVGSPDGPAVGNQEGKTVGAWEG
jgi:hypothetical protein